jgi:2-polyprenyl-3-methyl-5-hydroxy-6-metoxy-1,4-benzoquinol methylase
MGRVTDGSAMSVGQAARRVLGDRNFQRAGEVYRRVFVDLDDVVDCLPEMGETARVLDIGGGDGAVVNRLVERRAVGEVTMLDLSATLGGWLTDEARRRTRVMPETSVRDYVDMREQAVDFVLLSDVLHHIPPSARPEFFNDLTDLLRSSPGATLVVKDIDPSGWRGRLAFAADRYISGDRTVSAVPREVMPGLIRDGIARGSCIETDLYHRDSPNYCYVFPPADDAED